MQLVKKTLSDQIYDILKHEILTQKIEFGELLVNRSLQERFNVSSTPVRDAINRLFADGLVGDINKSGAKVIEFDLKFACEINEILMFIIQSGIYLSYKKADRLDVVNDLNKYIDLQKQHVGSEEYFDYDYNFHKTFVNYSSNERLIKLFKEYNVLQEVLVRSFYETNTKESQLKSINSHELMVKYFKDEEIDKLIKLNEEHYDNAEKLFKKKLKK